MPEVARCVHVFPDIDTGGISTAKKLCRFCREAGNEESNGRGNAAFRSLPRRARLIKQERRIARVAEISTEVDPRSPTVSVTEYERDGDEYATDEYARRQIQPGITPRLRRQSYRNEIRPVVGVSTSVTNRPLLANGPSNRMDFSV